METIDDVVCYVKDIIMHFCRDDINKIMHVFEHHLHTTDHLNELSKTLKDESVDLDALKAILEPSRQALLHLFILILNEPILERHLGTLNDTYFNLLHNILIQLAKMDLGKQPLSSKSSRCTQQSPKTMSTLSTLGNSWISLVTLAMEPFLAANDELRDEELKIQKRRNVKRNPAESEAADHHESKRHKTNSRRASNHGLSSSLLQPIPGA